ncbi:hypothetical protein GCM10023205_60660 [Yinghuangia aomiensis]|uniref:Uncharacterized protein n=1 Tax=Yinghuangia aomiensis TaxID=676205 RepID=A0ABP9HZE8_9ACTN
MDNMEEVEDEGDAEHFQAGVPIVVRGRAIHVNAAQGAPLESVFRSLVPEHRALLLADTDEVRARIPADIPLILRLEEWHQPPDTCAVSKPLLERDSLLEEFLAPLMAAAVYDPDPSLCRWFGEPAVYASGRRRVMTALLHYLRTARTRSKRAQSGPGTAARDHLRSGREPPAGPSRVRRPPPQAAPLRRRRCPGPAARCGGVRAAAQEAGVSAVTNHRVAEKCCPSGASP